MPATRITIDEGITVGQLSDKLMVPVTTLIGDLMKNGMLVTVNERLDFDTAQIVVSDMGLDVELVKADGQMTEDGADQDQVSKPASAANLQPRPPVVAVMGHVDHGKTSLLDRLRGSKVAASEAGGITQHISAYQIKHQGRLVTFLDTPGHAAFAALRQHGARLTDLGLIVVAADDGVKPQTLEAIRYASSAHLKLIIAINKSDLPGADPIKVKQQLADNGLLVEEWGGETVAIEVSAKTGQGLEQLMDMVLLVADVNDLKAIGDGPASGLIIESQMQKGQGPMAVALVQSGQLRAGDNLVAGGVYGRIRRLMSSDGQVINRAGPSTPVIINGFKSLPEFGDRFGVVSDEKKARQLASRAASSRRFNAAGTILTDNELLRRMSRSRETTYLKVVVKADVKGTLTAVLDGLKQLETDEVAVQIVAASVGPVNENDVHLASSAGASLYGFNIVAAPGLRRLAAKNGVDIKLYTVIYELLDDVRARLSQLLAPVVNEEELGRLIVKAIFKTTKERLVCGGEVTKGSLSLPARARLSRDGQALAEAEVVGLKQGPQSVAEVPVGQLCGLELKTGDRLSLAPGDHIDLYRHTLIARDL